MLFSLSDIETGLGPDMVALGRRLMNAERLPQPDVHRDGELVTSIIRRGKSRPLQVYVRVRETPGGKVRIEGECGCNQRRNCQHVAAVLLKALEREEPAPHRSVPSIGSALGTLAQRRPAAYAALPHLVYVVAPLRASRGGVPVELYVAREKNGGYAEARRYTPAWALRGVPPRFLSGDDLQLARYLAARQADTGGVNQVTDGAMLQRILATERCRHQDLSGPALRLGPPRPARLHWEIDQRGDQRPRWLSEPRCTCSFLIDELWYLDQPAGICGRLETALPPELVQTLGDNFRVAAQAVPQAREELVNRFPETVFALPEPMPVELLPAIAPVPCLRLESRRFDPGWGSQDLTVDLACLSFDYAGRRLRRSDPLSWVEVGRVLRLSRNEREEQACLQRLTGLGFFLDKKWSESTGTDSLLLPGPPEDWLELQYRAIPQLIEEGWRVEFADGFRFQLAQTGRWTAELEPARGNDWFNFSIGVETEAGPVNVLPALVRFIQEAPGDFRQERLRNLDEERPLFLPLADGRLLAIPLARLRPMLETLFELYDPGSLDAENRLPVGRFQLARLAELQELPQAGRLEWLGGEQLRRIGEQLRELARLQPVDPPTGLRPQLRDYQRSGLDWLQFLRRSGLAGILADDMGLGKTLQSLAHVLLEKEQGRLDRPALVVAPTSLMFNWRREAERFTPDLQVLTLQGPGRHTRFARIAHHDLVLTTYPLLARDRERLLEQAFHLLILDEAQVIKNPKSQASRVVRDLVARHRLCLTGTPMENHLGELWSLYDFLLPGLLGTRRQFTRVFRNPVEKDADKAVAGLLARRLRPFLLRRTKEQVVAELPPKTEILRSVQLQGAQRDLYESIRLAMHERVRKEVASKGLARSRLLILDSLLKLRQVCCDPRLVRLESARQVRQSAKLDLLMTLLPEMVEEGRRILLFSQFTRMLSLIEEALRQAGMPYLKLTGRSKDRATPVTRFQANEVPLFLISLKAGGVGLNLTAADTVIHYDPWWNPAVERQATDRAHRLGQDKPVFVYKLISDGTVEERMQALQTRKQALADRLYHTEETTEPQWTEADLDLLFEPLD